VNGPDHGLFGEAIAGVGGPPAAVPKVPSKPRYVEQASVLGGREPQRDPQLAAVDLGAEVGDGSRVGGGVGANVLDG
jgi:hypothetical protein